MALESVKYYYHTAILRNVYTIQKAIEILWIWYNGTCIDETCKNPFALLRQEPSQRGSVRPRAVVVEAQGRLLPLAGEAPVGGQAAATPARRAVRQVARSADQKEDIIARNCLGTIVSTYATSKRPRESSLPTQWPNHRLKK